ncbi:GPI-anchored surface protein, putative [Bodo saltans]|uniref:GPI-anchored surface protein, putative n=1 Tax=Bodo saltans TaxID=75058 RepID=A0A0S4JER6_BODSA|nr:GPI-anchored surface protein, putative [Bodo saltans]|eukprot:CUG89972.1 GPI-anchored surface protein, putative [Bodo saltans]
MASSSKRSRSVFAALVVIAMLYVLFSWGVAPTQAPQHRLVSSQNDQHEQWAPTTEDQTREEGESTTHAPREQTQPPQPPPLKETMEQQRGKQFPYYSFSSLFPRDTIAVFMKSCIIHDGARTVDRQLSRALLCSRNPRTPDVGCAEQQRKTPEQAMLCQQKETELLSCSAAFDTWLPCPRSSTSSGASKLEDCTAHYGLARVEAWVPMHCKSSSFWQLLVQSVCNRVSCAGALHQPSLVAGTFDATTLLLGDAVSRSQRRPAHAPAYIAPENRTVAPFPKHVQCFQPPSHNATAGRVATFHGINFGYPLDMMMDVEDEEEYVKRNSSGNPSHMDKLFGFSVSGPKSGGGREYGLNDEYRLMFDMRRSMFAFTTRRWGWDCLRHVEQLGAGILSLFIDLPLAPSTILEALPRRELFDALGRPEIRHVGALWTPESKPNPEPDNYFIYTGLHKQDGGAHVAINASVLPFVDVTRLDESDYALHRRQLLTYSRQHLTTAAMAASVLQRMGHPEARRVLYLHGVTHLDFLKVSMHHGLVNGLGLDVVSYPRSEAHFQAVNVSTMNDLEEARGRHLRAHGNGYGYGMRIYDGEEGHVEATNLERRIFNKEFDIILFSFTSYSPSLTKQLPLFREVVSVYPPDRIAFLNGDDTFGAPSDGRPPPLALYATKFGHVFMRELYPLAEVCPDPKLERTELLVQQGTTLAALRNTTNTTPNATTSSSSEVEGGVSMCNSAPVAATPFPFEHSSRVATTTDAFLAHVDPGNLHHVRSFVMSVREHSRLSKPLIVLIASEHKTLTALREIMIKGELDVARPVVVHFADKVANDLNYEGVSVQRRFLAAVQNVLMSPVVYGIQRFVVVYLDTPVLFRGDLLRSVGTSELWFTRHSILSNAHHVGSSRFCFGALPSVDPTHQLHIGHQLFGGYRGSLLQLISAVESVYSSMGSVWCGFDAALNFVLHNGTFDGRATVFSSERGPVVYDEFQSDAVCALYKPLVRPTREGSDLKSVTIPCAMTSLAAVVVGDWCKLIAL